MTSVGKVTYGNMIMHLYKHTHIAMHLVVTCDNQIHNYVCGYIIIISTVVTYVCYVLWRNMIYAYKAISLIISVIKGSYDTNIYSYPDQR